MPALGRVKQKYKYSNKNGRNPANIVPLDDE